MVADEDEEEDTEEIILETDSGVAETEDEGGEEIAAPTLDGIDFDRDEGCTNCIPGSNIEITEVSSTEDESIKVEESVDQKKPRIGALGINLIIFSTLLLCFVFVCMRR